MKSDVERGPFGSWAVHARDLLDVSAEWVASELGYHDATIRKMEAGGSASRRIRQKLPELYRKLASEKGISLPPLPQETRPTPEGDLAAAIRDQTEAMRALVEELKAARDTQVGRDSGLAAALADLANTLERLRLAPADRSQ